MNIAFPYRIAGDGRTAAATDADHVRDMIELLLFTHTGVINGWTLAQMIVLLGVYYIIQGANSVMFEASFERFSIFVAAPGEAPGL